MTKLTQYTPDHFDALNAYQLSDEQAEFTASIAYCINERKDLDDPLKILVTIMHDDVAVGFFILDRGGDKAKLTDNPNAVLVRSLSINPAYQGKGIGTEAMRLIPALLREHSPSVTEITLSVNCRNKGAYHTYLKAGYTDTKHTIEGPAGNQNVLNFTLSAKAQ